MRKREVSVNQLPVFAPCQSEADYFSLAQFEGLLFDSGYSFSDVALVSLIQESSITQARQRVQLPHPPQMAAKK
jgi:hypothetical protein